MTEKLSQKTERVHHTLPLSECLDKFKLSKLSYLSHQYQVHNDTYQWPQVLSTVPTLGPIYHMDYSESLPQLFKFEPQSFNKKHFNKKQYSLHCTVMHLEDQNKYIYHLSDHLTHNFAFTFCVINHLVGLHDETPLICFKSDNCSTQYKCKHVFGKCKDLAVKIGFPIIWY